MAAPKAICIVRTETLAKEFIVEPTTPVEEFMKMIAENFQHNLEKLEFLLQNSVCPMLAIDPKVPTLSDTGIIFDNEARNVIMLMSTEKKSSPPSNKEQKEESEKVETTDKFRGLINLSNTCYLNCYLQSLYMTPEIRNRVFQWRLTANDSCILFQLQKLFVKLEVSDEGAVSTREFTNAFKWFVEHMQDHQDVHEFLAALLDGIQESSKKFALPDLVKDFFEGSLLERIKCTECQVTKCKEVPLLHLQLPVKNIEGDMYSRIEESIGHYTSTELLSGGDQLSCDNCGKKTDTEKSQVFKGLPYILNLSLSRFDFDRTKMRVVKINGSISFPLHLEIHDMNNVPFQYELISVIVHKGIPSVGHYFAMIKDVTDSEWYKFDDRNVYPIDNEELERAYGGCGNSTAYVFLYRLVDDKNELPVKKENFPEDLKKLAKDVTGSKEAVYVFKVYLKRGDKITFLRKFINFGFNTLEDLRRRITSHINAMFPEIDTDDIRLASYNMDDRVVEKYFEERDFRPFLSDFMESLGDAIGIVYEANKERDVEDDPYLYTIERCAEEETATPSTSSSIVNVKNEEKGESAEYETLNRCDIYNDSKFLRNYTFRGRIILSAELLELQTFARFMLNICEDELSSRLFSKKELFKFIYKVMMLCDPDEDVEQIEFDYPHLLRREPLTMTRFTT